MVREIQGRRHRKTVRQELIRARQARKSNDNNNFSKKWLTQRRLRSSLQQQQQQHHSITTTISVSVNYVKVLKFEFFLRWQLSSWLRSRKIQRSQWKGREHENNSSGGITTKRLSRTAKPASPLIDGWRTDERRWEVSKSEGGEYMDGTVAATAAAAALYNGDMLSAYVTRWRLTTVSVCFLSVTSDIASRWDEQQQQEQECKRGVSRMEKGHRLCRNDDDND